jgi:hypothetical protein
MAADFSGAASFNSSSVPRRNYLARPQSPGPGAITFGLRDDLLHPWLAQQIAAKNATSVSLRQTYQRLCNRSSMSSAAAALRMKKA